MSAIHEYKQLLKRRGIRLCDAFGVDDIALSDIALEQVDALAVVEILRKDSIPILGGDVYFMQHDGRIEFAYANWHSDPLLGEEWQHFVSRSYLETGNYIKGFPLSEATPLFVLTINDDYTCSEGVCNSENVESENPAKTK
jgi:hypothetical protein